MDSKLIKDIKERMKANSTAELLEILNSHDKTQYSEEAFEAIRQILDEQGVHTSKEKSTMSRDLSDREENEGNEEDEGNSMSAFFSFETMITGSIIQFIFWAGILTSIIAGVWVLIVAIDESEPIQILYGILLIVLGPFVVRVLCEFLILPFRINRTLSEIKNKLKD